MRAPRLRRSLCAGSRPTLLDLVSDRAVTRRAARENRRPAGLCVLRAAESAARRKTATASRGPPAAPSWGWLDAVAPVAERVLCAKEFEAEPTCSDELAPSVHRFPGVARPWYLAGPLPATIIPLRPAVARKRGSPHIPRRTRPSGL
jgi:hypothetical protein